MEVVEATASSVAAAAYNVALDLDLTGRLLLAATSFAHALLLLSFFLLGK
jgi:hypothetical protein